MKTKLTTATLAVLTVFALLFSGNVLAEIDSEKTSSVSTIGHADTTELRGAVEVAKNRILPALVHIQPAGGEVFANGRKQKARWLGSGAIVSEDGYVITNHHVAMGLSYGISKGYICTLSTKEDVPATLVGTDIFTDLAVLKLDLSGFDGEFSVASFGDSSNMAVGDHVLALGSPMGLSQTMTLGIVSNTERMFITERNTRELTFLYNQPTGIFNRWIQIDAPCNPGNSGGPIVNLRGEIIGVLARGNPFANDLGFAIPADIAKEVFNEIVATGKVTRGYIGITAQATKHSEYKHGTLAGSVAIGSPADTAGLQAGDLITHINGKAVDTRFVCDLPLYYKTIADLPVGEPVEVTYERNGNADKVTFNTQLREPMLEREEEFKEWGLTAADITGPMARQMKLSHREGVLVTGVRSSWPADGAKPAIRSFTVIRSVGGDRIHNLDDFRKAYDASKSGERPVVVEIADGDNILLCVLKNRRDEESKPGPISLRKAWIGVSTQVLTRELAEALAVDASGGVRVANIYAGTQAADSELHVGDIITEVDGNPVSASLESDNTVFSNMIKRLRSSHNASLTVSRGGKDLEIAVKLETEPLPASDAKKASSKDFDLTVREVVFGDRIENRWSNNVSGVIAVEIDMAGWCGLAGLLPGELIEKIDGLEIHTAKAFREAIESIKAEKPAKVTFFVRGATETRFVHIDCDWE